MVDNNLAFAPTYELAELIASKKVSPVEVTQLYWRLTPLAIRAAAATPTMNGESVICNTSHPSAI